MNKPKISVAIPTYQRADIAYKTVKDILDKQSFQDFEVLVIDQTISDEILERKIRKIRSDRVHYFRITPPSLPAARNFALTHANSPIILFLDDDIEADSCLIDYHLKIHNANEDISAVGGRVLQKGFPTQKKVLEFDELSVSHGVFTATQSGYTNAFPGGNHSLKVKDALKVGGFDTRYYGNAFREESDMSLKMSRNGMKIFFESKAIITHLAIPTGGSRAKKYTGHLYDNADFYKNELFFTLRTSKRPFSALRVKYGEYTHKLSMRHKLKRSYLFILGILSAVWRMIFGKKIISEEIVS